MRRAFTLSPVTHSLSSCAAISSRTSSIQLSLPSVNLDFNRVELSLDPHPQESSPYLIRFLSDVHLNIVMIY